MSKHIVKYPICGLCEDFRWISREPHHGECDVMPGEKSPQDTPCDIYRCAYNEQTINSYIELAQFLTDIDNRSKNIRPIMILRVFEAFAGYGSQSIALGLLAETFPDFHFETVGISEIDKYAIKAYQTLHGSSIPNYGDITKVDWTRHPTLTCLHIRSPAKTFLQQESNVASPRGAVHVHHAFGRVLMPLKRNVRNSCSWKM